MTTIDQHLSRLGLGPSRWSFPPPEVADPHGFVASGGDLAPETLITAYCSGLFPMPLGRRNKIGWWSPDPRGVLPLENLRVTRSLRRSLRRFDVRVDTAFVEVMTRCGDPRRPHGWINAEFIAAYERLFHLGVAHSVECWDEHNRLVGGLYGVSIGGLFAGESMFHLAPDASKVALVALCDIVSSVLGVLLDIQWLTEHLASLGAIEVPRANYLERLAVVIDNEAPIFPQHWAPPVVP